MIFSDHVIYEMGYRTNSRLFEVEQDRLARLATAGRSKGSSLSGARRMAVQLGDYLAGLRCLLQSRFAANTGATAC